MPLVKINTPVHYHVKKYRICKNKICQGPVSCFDVNMVVSTGMARTLNLVRRGGTEGATKDGGWEGGNKGRVVTVVEGGSNDARECGSGSIGRVGGLRKGTSEEGTELCMDGARGRGDGGSERRREGATEGGRGAIKGGSSEEGR